MNGILYSGPMSRADEDGRKTMTRRIIDPQPPNEYVFKEFVYEPRLAARFENPAESPGLSYDAKGNALGMWTKRCPYQPGDRFYKKETYAVAAEFDHRKPSEVPQGSKVWYLADGPKPAWCGRTRSGRFMPQWMSRGIREVIKVRAERLQEITEEDARREGIPKEPDCDDIWTGPPLGGGIVKICFNARDAFKEWWDFINGKKAPWDSNPWVWVYEYKKVEA